MNALDTAKTYLRTLAAGDVDAALALLSDKVHIQGPDGSIMNKTDYRNLLLWANTQTAAPMTMTVVATTAEAHRVAVEATGSALLKNGRTYQNIYHFVFEVHDQQITRFHEYCNMNALKVFEP